MFLMVLPDHSELNGTSDSGGLAGLVWFILLLHRPVSNQQGVTVEGSPTLPQNFHPALDPEEGAASHREGWMLRTRSQKPRSRLHWLITVQTCGLLFLSPGPVHQHLPTCTHLFVKQDN